jgi:hypothetical protein
MSTLKEQETWIQFAEITMHCGQPYIYVLQVGLQIHFINLACHAYLFQVQKYICINVYSQCVVFEIN